jgi:effector-binding domain-containing protein
MFMFRKILFVVGILLAVFLSGGMLLPRFVHVERSIEIERPASTVFVLLNGFNLFTSWSPWAARDPDAVYEYSGPASGVGARMDWSGDPRLVGTGWQEITGSEPYSMVRTHLDFDQQGQADAYFQISEAGSGVHLTWGFDTDLLEGQSFLGGIIAKYFGLFFDQWIGSDYEQGLANLKAFAESLPGENFSDLNVKTLDVEALNILYISSGVSQNSVDIADVLDAAYQELSAFIKVNELEVNGGRMAITRAWDEEGYRFDAAIPVLMKPVELTGNVRAGQSPSGPSVRVVHRGPYERMTPSYGKLAAYMAAHGLREGPVSWEYYISDPLQTPGDDLITHIYFQIAQ